jgi:streptogramin lyase
VGNALTRVPRDKAAWQDTVNRMGGFLAMMTDREADGIADTLTRGFTGAPPKVVETYDVQPELAHARVHEWLLGDGFSFVHDTMVGQDGKLYGADEGHDIIWRLDRASGKIEQFHLPDIDLPVGGMFSGLQIPLGVFTGKHGPHSMVQTKDGRIWFTGALSSTLGSFDPAAGTFKMYPLGRMHLYPHTIRLDHKGIIWFTCVASNQVMRFDPATETFTTINLPHNGFWRWMTDVSMPAMTKLAAWFPGHDVLNRLSPYKMPWTGQDHSILNFPYGIDVNPTDGSIWYAKLYVNKIGRIDPETLEVTEYDTPMRGPRRPRFDAHGILWIPAFGDSGLMRFDPKTRTFKTWKLPLLAPNEYEVPYALNVHPKTGDIWITSNMSDRTFRFIPATERFITYPSPTRVTWMRDWDFTSDGQACSSNSNLPAYGIEDGKDNFVCIDPDGVDREAAE